MVREVTFFMTGLIWYGTDFRCKETRIMGLPMLAVTLPEKEGLRQRLFSRRAAQLMGRRGIRACVFPADFPQKALFQRKGVLPVDRRPLLREKAGQWVLAERQVRGLTGSVAVAAERVTGEAAQAVEILLKRVGRVELLLAPGAEELQRRLRWETGAPLRLVTEEQLKRNETLLNFSPRPERGQALTLCPEEPGNIPRFLLPRQWAEELPAGIEEDDFCVLLRRYGRLTAGEIGVKSRK